MRLENSFKTLFLNGRTQRQLYLSINLLTLADFYTEFDKAMFWRD